MENRSLGNRGIFDDLTAVFSEERLGRYVRENKGDKHDAIISYSWNIELSQFLYPAIQILEVSIRNTLHRTLTDCFDTSHWFDDAFLYDAEHRAVRQAKEKLLREKKPIEPGRIVAELSFGFWTSLFDVRYEHQQVLWPKLLKPVFPYMPRGQRTRTFLSRKLNQVRLLRNRVFHYEPIWHWKDLQNQHDDIVHLIRWLSPVANEYLKFFDQFPEVCTVGRSIAEMKLKKLETLS